jgi:UDP-N-acetylmuramyl pentapeptide phosphotransferase/UDP-N-acetylglucosamine-1-phosphate transferase
MVLAASYLDDRDALPPRLRLGVHIAAAVVLILFGPLPTRLLLPGLEIPLALPVGALLTVIYVTWLINLYNFMDGLDGLAGGMGVIGFGTFAVLGGVAGHVPFSAVNLIIATATAGFLLVNFPPARLFMGDIGSTGLGLLAAVMSLWGDTNGIFPLWIGILVFSPFFVDASLTLLIRLIRKDNLFEAHQDHWYQQLARSGRSARRVLSIEYPLMLGCAASALLAPVLTAGGQWVVIGLWFGLYAVLLTRFLQKGFRSDSAR